MEQLKAKKGTTMATEKFTSAPWQTRPVFISSTFKDMQAERDYLRHVVFPRLNEELRKARIRLELIDLRQGVETADIAHEESRERLVLKVCLDEIKRSRPFLIVLLGDRYGWVPPEERMLAVTEEVGFEAAVHDKSVTALEIEFGIVKESPEQRQRSFFYFRDPLPYGQMPEKHRADFNDIYSTDPQTRDRHGRLAELKKSLSDDPELAPRVHRYRTKWDSRNHKVIGLDGLEMEWGDGEKWFGELTYQHLLGELQAEIAAATTLPPQSWEDQERAALAEFIEHRRRDFTGRQQLLEDLTNLARSETPPGAVFALASGITWGACLTGDPGSGKSAIFAELVARLSEGDSSSRSRETSDDSILVLTNAAGATPRGSQVAAMLERFIEELAEVLGDTTGLPENATPDDVDTRFASLLGRVAVKRRVVVLLDALNQFDPTPRAEYMTWLRPKQWPGNARLIATSLVGQPAEALSQWAGIEELEVPALTNTGKVSFQSDSDNGPHQPEGERRMIKVSDDVDAIAQSVWQRYHRAVNPAVLQLLKEKRLTDGSLAASNPLWLTLALEQINLLDADDFARAERDFSDLPVHERLRAMQIATVEEFPPTVAELYELLLAQSEKLFGAPAARAFAAVIAVSRFGWRESDLLALIPATAGILCPDKPIPKMDDLRLAELRRSFRAHLTRRGTLSQLDFFHAQMRQAVENRVLSDSSQRHAIHRTIADHLESRPLDDALRNSELMAHLIAGDDRARAARVYADLTSPRDIQTAATQALTQHVVIGAKDHPNANAAWVTTLLTQRDLLPHEVAKLAHRFNFELHDALADSLGLDDRESLLQAACAALLQLNKTDPTNTEWLRELSVSTEKLGIVTLAQGNLSEAQRLAGGALQMTQRLIELDPANIVWQRDLTVSLRMLGELTAAQGNVPVAHWLISKALQIAQRFNEADRTNAEWQCDLSEMLGGLSDLIAMEGDLIEAQRISSEALRIARLLVAAHPNDLEFQSVLSVSFERFGNLAIAKGNLTEAERNYCESLQVRQRQSESDPRSTNWQWLLGQAHCRVGNVHTQSGNLPKARESYESYRTIMKRLVESNPTNVYWQRELTVALGKLGTLAASCGDLSAAQSHFGEALRCRQLLAGADPSNAEWQFDLAISYERLGDLAAAQFLFDDAHRFHMARHLIIRRLTESDPANTSWQRDLSVSIEKLGNLAKSRGDFSEAIRLYREANLIALRLAEIDPMNAAWQHDLSVSLIKLGELARIQGNLPEAQLNFDKCCQILRRLAASDPTNSEWQRDLSVSLSKLGELASAQGNLSEAQRLYSEDLRITQRLAQSDPTNAVWQRDLAITHHKRAMFFQKIGDNVNSKTQLRECYLVLVRMLQNGQHFDPQTTQVYRNLHEMFGEN